MFGRKCFTVIPIGCPESKSNIDEYLINKEDHYLIWQETLSKFVVQTDILGSFQPVKQLGQGSFGSVMLANRLKPMATLRPSLRNLTNQVALKIISIEMLLSDSRVLKNLENEI